MLHLRRTPFFTRRHISGAKKGFKVTLIGGAGLIAQAMAMLLKLSPLVSDLNLYDIRPVSGLALDISHICSTCQIRGYEGLNRRKEALEGSDIVIICCGNCSHATTETSFETNATMVRDLTVPIVENCPQALIGVLSDPVNSLVPLLNETMKNLGVDHGNRIFGVPTIDLIRSKIIIAESKGKNPNVLHVPVVGGQSGETVVPLLSRISPRIKFSTEEVSTITKRIKDTGKEWPKGHLSMAFAGSHFTLALCRGLKGDENITECAYVKSDVTNVGYFSTPIVLGKSGIQKNLGLGELSDFEKHQVDDTVTKLEKDIERGINFLKK